RDAARVGDVNQVAVVLVAEDFDAVALRSLGELGLVRLAGGQLHAVLPVGRLVALGLHAGHDRDAAGLGDVDEVAVVLVAENFDAELLGVLVEVLLASLADAQLHAMLPLGRLGLLGGRRAAAGHDGDAGGLTDVDEVAVVLVAEDLDAELLGVVPLGLAGLADADLHRVLPLGRLGAVAAGPGGRQREADSFGDVEEAIGA